MTEKKRKEQEQTLWVILGPLAASTVEEKSQMEERTRPRRRRESCLKENMGDGGLSEKNEPQAISSR